MAPFFYALCALTALICAIFLFQAYRRTKYRLLLWGGICFAGLTLNNAVLFSDRTLFPEADLSTWRLSIAFVSIMVLVYGLIWDSE